MIAAEFSWDRSKRQLRTLFSDIEIAIILSGKLLPKEDEEGKVVVEEVEVELKLDDYAAEKNWCGSIREFFQQGVVFEL